MLFKLVNGVRRALTGVEEAAVRAEWAASDAQAVRDAPIREIEAIEKSDPLTQRDLREMALALGTAYPKAQTTVFYRRAAAQEAAIEVLRPKEEGDVSPALEAAAEALPKA